MKSLLFILSVFFVASQTQAKAISEYSQDELQNVVANFPGCAVSIYSGEELFIFRLVSVPAKNGASVYFIEVTEPSGDQVVLLLEKTGNPFGGYEMRASETRLGIGWDIEVTLIELDGFDIKIDSAKDGWVGPVLEGYNHCPFLR